MLFRCIKLSLMILLAFNSTVKGQNPYINTKQDIAAINNRLAGYCKPLERFDLLNQKAGYFIAVGNLDSLNPASQEMLILAQELQNDSALIATYNIIGDYFLLKGSWADGLEYLFKGIRLAEQTGNKGYLCSMCLDASHIYAVGLENFPNALNMVVKPWHYLAIQYFLKPIYLCRCMRHLQEFLSGQMSRIRHCIIPSGQMKPLSD
jgi:hypothetical protein